MIRQVLIGMIRGYQILFSPLKPACCRFCVTPSIPGDMIPRKRPLGLLFPL
ncbi:MAG: membrane protein insertion efficiency factor YidD [Nitrospirae bacterium]|nr:membrane protein insertion efficiency factor YidD [Nitrospirota bacterium]